MKNVPTHTNREEKLLEKCTFSSLATDRCETMHEKCVYLEINESAKVLWLPRYYCDSHVAIRVESTGAEGDKSINDRVTIVLTSSSKFQKI